MIPLETSEIEEWSPPSLNNLSSPPVFRLRPASGREERKYQDIMRREGLAYHGKEAMRGEVLRALSTLYTGDQAQASEARLNAYWALLDQKAEPDPAEVEAVDDLVARLTREWRPLREMAADNMRFVEDSLRIALSMFLVGWSKFDLSFRREDGRAPLDLILDLEAKLAKIEKRAVADKVEGVKEGLAFLELCVAAHARLHLTEDEEKNSDSPPSTPLDQSGSTKTPSERADASSKASASSRAGRRGSSTSSRGKRGRRGSAASES